MKPIVIAGNGPSLAKIDYTRLPQDFDVFRCNQFYFEDRYFLGKKIKGASYPFEIFKEQYFTLHALRTRGEYEVEDVYCKIPQEAIDFHKSFPNVKNINDFLKTKLDFLELERFYQTYFCKQPTSGIYMFLTALAQGYKEIYLIGIDLYRGGG